MERVVAVSARRVLLDEGVEGMRVRRHDPVELVSREGRRGVLDQRVEQALLAGEPLGIAERLLLRAEDRPVDAERRGDPREGAGRVLAAGVEAPVVLHVEQHVDGRRVLGEDPDRDPRGVGPLRPASLVLAERVAVPEGLLEDVLQFGRHRGTGERGLAHGRHDSEHVDPLRADAQAVAAGRAEPQVGVGHQLGAGLDLAVDLARTIIADHVDGAGRYAPAAAVAPFEGLSAGQRRDRGEAFRAVVREDPGLEHPVPHRLEFHLASRDGGGDGGRLHLHGDGRDLAATYRHGPRTPRRRRRAGGARDRAGAGSPG